MKPILAIIVAVAALLAGGAAMAGTFRGIPDCLFVYECEDATATAEDSSGENHDGSLANVQTGSAGS